MQKILYLIIIYSFLYELQAQDADSVLGIPNATTAEILAITGANQGSLMYSSNDNVLYVYNGIAWVVLSMDNLGNHIASQNLQTNGNWISGDGDTEGVFIDDNSGNVGISNVAFTPARQFHVAGSNGGIRLDRFGNDSFFFFVNMNNTGTTVLQNWAFINDDGDNSFQIRNYGTLVGGPGLFTPFRIKQNNQLQLGGYGTSTAFNNNSPTKLLGVEDDGSVVQVDPVTAGVPVAYEKIVIWAEEAAALSDNTLEWSFGNNAQGAIGIPLPEEWEAYAVSFDSDTNGANDSVEIAITNSGTNTNIFTFTATAGGNVDNMIYTEILATPVTIPAGTSIGFRTVNENGVIGDARVAVFLRRRP